MTACVSPAPQPQPPLHSCTVFRAPLPFEVTGPVLPHGPCAVVLIATLPPPLAYPRRTCMQTCARQNMRAAAVDSTHSTTQSLVICLSLFLALPSPLKPPLSPLPPAHTQYPLKTRHQLLFSALSSYAIVMMSVRAAREVAAASLQQLEAHCRAEVALLRWGVLWLSAVQQNGESRVHHARGVRFTVPTNTSALRPNKQSGWPWAAT